MRPRWRTVVGACAAGISAAVPLVVLYSFEVLPVWAVFTLLGVNAVGYSALLFWHACTDRRTAAAVTALAASACAIMLFFWPVLAVLLWPCVYVLAWSLARRRAVGVLSVLASLAVIVVGYAVLVGYAISTVPDVGAASAMPGLVVIVWATTFVANGILWAEETLHDRFVAPRATTVER